MPSKSVVRLADHYIGLRGLPADLDPATVLLTEMARCEAAVEFLDELVMTFSGEEITSIPKVVQAPDNDKWAVAYHVPMEVWRLWVENRKMLAAVSAQVVKLGLEERRLAQHDERARQTYLFIQSLLQDPTVGLDPHQRRQIGMLIAEKLRTELAIEAMAKDVPAPEPVMRRDPLDNPEPTLRLVTDDGYIEELDNDDL